MIIVKLLTLVAVILVLIGLFKFGWSFLKELDEVDIDAKIKDIEVKSDLADKVESYIEKNSDRIEKSKTNTISEFLSE